MKNSDGKKVDILKKDVAKSDQRRAYSKPQIIHEIELEVRAGSSMGDELPPGVSSGG